MSDSQTQQEKKIKNCTGVAWNHVRLHTAWCFALWRAAKGWERRESKLELASLVFPWRERSLILMTFERQVCISFWSVTSCGEVYILDGRISFGHSGASHMMGGTLFRLQQPAWKHSSVEVSVKEICMSIKSWHSINPCGEILLLSAPLSTERSQVRNGADTLQKLVGTLLRFLTICLPAATFDFPCRRGTAEVIAQSSPECRWATFLHFPELTFTPQFYHWATHLSFHNCKAWSIGAAD